METGKRIERLMDSKDIKQNELANSIGMNKSVLNRIILGTRAVRDDELVSIANALDVSVDYLVGNPKGTQNDLKQLLQEGSMTYGGKEISERNIKVLSRVVQSFLEEVNEE